MASDRDLDDLVAPLREDNLSGASELAPRAAEVLRRAALETPSASLDDLRDALGRACHRLLDAQPSMASMVTVARLVLEALDDAGTLEDGRLAAARTADAFRSGFPERTRRVVEAAVEVLPVGGTVATISSSGTVRELLASHAGPRSIRVVCFESRPVCEGRSLAEALADGGVDVTYAVDAAIGSLAPEIDVVLLGADSVGDAGVVNKIGSLAVARAAHAAGVPAYVLTDATKLLPPGWPQPLDDDRPAGEVWADAPAGVRVWNRYFEVVPMALLRGVVTDEGLFSPADLGRAMGGIDLPVELRSWAAPRARS